MGTKIDIPTFLKKPFLARRLSSCWCWHTEFDTLVWSEFSNNSDQYKDLPVVWISGQIIQTTIEEYTTCMFMENLTGIRTRKIPCFKRTMKELAIATQRLPLTFKLNAQMNDRKTTSTGDKYTTKPNQTRNATNKSSAISCNFKSTHSSCIQACPNSLSHFTY